MAFTKIVLANGVFDLFHIGHMRYLTVAAEMGTLIVAVTRDAFVNKGVGRPLYKEVERLELIKGIKYVTNAFLVDSSTDGLMRMRPDIFVKGAEYRGKILPADEEFCRRNSIEIRFTDTEEKRPHDRIRQN